MVDRPTGSWSIHSATPPQTNTPRTRDACMARPFRLQIKSSSGLCLPLSIFGLLDSTQIDHNPQPPPTHPTATKCPRRPRRRPRRRRRLLARHQHQGTYIRAYAAVPLSLAVWSDIVHPGLYCKPRNPDPHHPKHQTHTLRTPLPPPKINTTKNTLFKNKKNSSGAAPSTRTRRARARTSTTTGGSPRCTARSPSAAPTTSPRHVFLGGFFLCM